MSHPSEQAIGDLSPTTTTGFVVAVVIIVFLLFLLLFCIYLHTKEYRFARSSTRDPLIFITNQHTVPRKGLDSTILESLPITVFRSKDFVEGLECAVCLSELSEGEEVRLLPICNHGFHLECINMWFHSNSTCPLCRSLVCNDSMQREVPTSEPPPDFMENVMLWDSEGLVRPGVVGAIASTNQGSLIPEGASSMNAEGMLVIEIPRGVVDGSSSTSSQLTPIRNIEVNTKSPRMSRLKSLRRILSWGSKGVSSCSPRGGDVEQGTPTVPKTPHAREQVFGIPVGI